MLEAISIAFLLLAVYSSSGTQEETFGANPKKKSGGRPKEEPKSHQKRGRHKRRGEGSGSGEEGASQEEGSSSTENQQIDPLEYAYQQIDLAFDLDDIAHDTYEEMFPETYGHHLSPSEFPQFEWQRMDGPWDVYNVTKSGRSKQVALAPDQQGSYPHPDPKTGTFVYPDGKKARSWIPTAADAPAGAHFYDEYVWHPNSLPASFEAHVRFGEDNPALQVAQNFSRQAKRLFSDSEQHVFGPLPLSSVGWSHDQRHAYAVLVANTNSNLIDAAHRIVKQTAPASVNVEGGATSDGRAWVYVFDAAT